MLKIGIITFHWGTNYGAVIQAYALQTYLSKLGHDVSIINYRPKRYKKTLLKCFLTPRIWNYKSRIKEYLKEFKLKKFRSKYLNETILYKSQNGLKCNAPKLDVYICGSDQIWNPTFTIGGEGKPTSTYFLNFGGSHVRRIAYAVSFGCKDYPKAAAEIAKKYISSFKAISVRENSGLEIVSKLGVNNAVKLADPTLLLKKKEYEVILKQKAKTRNNAFVYILRGENQVTKKIKAYLNRNYAIESPNSFFNQYSLEGWLGGIYNASIVLTNSFHGMVFALIFHVPFIVLPAKRKGSGMNDRFNTLLSHLNLEHRMITEFEVDKLDKLIQEEIDWHKIDQLLAKYKSTTDIFFNEALN